MSLLNHGIKPNLFNRSAMSTSTENQINVFQAPVSFKISFHSSTPVNNNNDRAINAVNVASMLIMLPVIQSSNEMMKIVIIYFSAVDIFPIVANSLLAQFLAFGVSLVLGGYIL